MKIATRIESTNANTNKIKLKYVPPVTILLTSAAIKGPSGGNPGDQPFGSLS